MHPWLDTALDRTIVGGYTSLGYRLRRPGWPDGELARMDGRTVLVTGATSGLGSAAAGAFAGLGAAVRLLVRDRERGEVERRRLSERTGNGEIEVIVCDLSDLASVRAAVERLEGDGERLDVLVNNAGVLAPERATTVDGHELTFATNVLGPFLLTNLLLGKLRASRDGRVINVSSGGMYGQRLDVEKLLDPPGEFDGTAAYARTKRAEVVLTELWAERESRGPADGGPSFHSMHPGWADTAGLRSSLPGFHRLTKPLLRTPEQGADTIVWLGAAPAQAGGGFWHDRRRRPTHLVPWTREPAEERARLWDTCARLTV